MSTANEIIKDMKKRAQASVACIEMRRLYEQLRKEIPHNEKFGKEIATEQIYGCIEITEKSWVHIRLNALLPHCKVTGGTQYVTDSILRLLGDYPDKLPFYTKAFIGIIECCPVDCSDVFDHDNTGFNLCRFDVLLIY